MADPDAFSFQVSKLTKVEFNCLKLVLSIDSWVAVLDFFGVAADEPDRPEPSASPNNTSELKIAISRGLSIFSYILSHFHCSV